MGKASFYQTAFTATAMMLLLPASAASAKQRYLSGWSCSLNTQSGRFYWSVNAGSVWGNDLYWETNAGPFVLTTLYQMGDRQTGKMTPRTVEVAWDGTLGLTHNRIELTDPEAGQWDDPIEASSWFYGEPSMSLKLGWKTVAQLSSNFPNMVVSVRDLKNRVAETQTFATARVAAPQDEVRSALLQMAKISANFEKSDQCHYDEELMEIVVG